MRYPFEYGVGQRALTKNMECSKHVRQHCTGWGLRLKKHGRKRKPAEHRHLSLGFLATDMILPSASGSHHHSLLYERLYSSNCETKKKEKKRNLSLLKLLYQILFVFDFVCVYKEDGQTDRQKICICVSMGMCI